MENWNAHMNDGCLNVQMHFFFVFSILKYLVKVVLSFAQSEIFSLITTTTVLNNNQLM